MNRFLKLFTLFSLFMMILTNVCYATKPLPTPPGNQVAPGVYLEHKTEPYTIDSLYIVGQNKVTENFTSYFYKKIYVSEGNEIKEVKPLDIDSDGKIEYLVSMFTGGSGGFYDLAIIKEKENEEWGSIWQSSFAQPTIELVNKENKTSIKIEHYEIINDTPQKVTSVIDYEKGKFVKH